MVRNSCVFDPAIRRDIRYGDFASRGVSLWEDSLAAPGQACGERVFIANPQSQLVGLDARTGQPCTDFGIAGRVDLLEGLRIPPFEPAAYSVTSPPAILGDPGDNRIVDRGQYSAGSAQWRGSRLRRADG